MATNAQINIDANLSAAERKVQDFIRKEYNLNLNFGKAGQPLGRITGQVSEFNKSLDAANARVVAFGASASVLYGLNKAFDALISSSIEVQKSLTDINVILNVSESQLNKFGNSLFDVAKNTGQSFKEVANAATEFSRQGLGIEETLKRTSDALILSRLSGLDTVKSVEALTAAVNSFASQAVTASDIVNKFANVDAAFAVSSKDLAEAISRVGSSAAQSGVSLDELIGLVTSAQQTTARGGAVIGNSFKTIFTRLQREKVVNLLESLGVSTTDSQGQLKSTISLLQGLANVYSDLGTQQQAAVAEAVGGVFQINILKAALADLGKEYSVYGNAVQISSTSTDEAIQRNEALNKTLAAQINQLQQNATQFASKAGGDLFGPALQRLVGGGNDILSSLNNADTSSVGAKLGEGILKGIGQVLAGPGLILISGILLKLFADFAKFGTGSVKELLGLNNVAKQQEGIQESITNILAKNPQLYSQIASGALTVNEGASILLNLLKAQTIELEKQGALTSALAGKVYAGGGRVSGKTVTAGQAAGYIPAFAQEESNARSLGASGGVRAMFGKGTIGGQPIIMNNQETEILGYGKNGDSAIIPNYARGYIPNFAKQTLEEKIAERKKILEAQNANKGSYGRPAKKGEKPNLGTVDLGNEFDDIFAVVFAGGGTKTNFTQNFSDIAQLKSIAAGKASVNLTKSKPLFPPTAQQESDGEKIFDSKINNFLSAGLSNLIGDVENSLGFQKTDTRINASDILTSSVKGTIFEKTLGIASAKGQNLRVGDKDDQSSFDYRPISNFPLLQELVGVNTAVEAKISAGSANNIPGKIFNSPEGKSSLNRIINKVNQSQEVKGRAAGYIPNFADALNNSIAREIGAGAPKNGIYVKQYSDLANSDNPDGLGVFNKRDEGSVSREKGAMRRKGYARGYIPNFADDSSGASFGAIATELSGMALMLGFSRSQIKEEYDREILERKQAIAEQKIQNSRYISGLEQRVSDLASQHAKESSLLAKATGDEIAVRQRSTAQLAERMTQLNSTIAIAKENILKNVQLSKVETTKAGLNAAGSQAALLATFAPILTSTIAAGIDQTTKGGRGNAAAVGGIGDVASFAGAGFMVGQGTGAAVGAVIGGMVALDKYLKEINTSLPEFEAKSKEASQNLSNFGNSVGVVMPLIEKLSNVREKEGGAYNTKTQSELVQQISKQASSFSPEIYGKLSGAGFNMDSAREIFAAENKKLSESKISADKQAQIVGYTDKAKEGGVLQGFGRLLNGGIDLVKSGVTSALGENAGKIYEDVALTFNPIASNQRDMDKGGAAAAGMGIGKTLASDVISQGKAKGKSLQDISKEQINLAKSGSLSDLQQYGVASDAIDQMSEKAIEAKEVFTAIQAEVQKAIAAEKIATQNVIKFSDIYGSVISELETSKAALKNFAEIGKLTGKNVYDEKSFGYNFKQGRNVEMASVVGELGFANASKKLSIQNDFAGTIGKSKFDASNNLAGAVFSTLTKNAEKLVPTGKVTGATGIKQGEIDLKAQIEKIGELSGSGDKNIFGSVKTTLEQIAKIPTQSVNTGFGQTDIIDVNKVLDTVKNSANFGEMYQGDDAAKAIDSLKGTLDEENNKLIAAQREFATAAAKQIDDLIKVTIQQLDKVGGGIDQVLSDQGPQAGRKVEEAAIGYLGVQNNKNATPVQLGREALQTGRAVNNLMGGIPVFDQNSQIFKDTQAGTKAGLKEDFNTSQEAVRRTKGGDKLAKDMESQLITKTGGKTLDEALGRVAQLQSARALGLKDTDTAYGKKMYQDRVDAAKAEIKSKYGAEGEAMAKSYETATALSEDPAAQATYVLKDTISTLIGTTNELLRDRLGGKSVAAIDVQKTSDLKIKDTMLERNMDKLAPQGSFNYNVPNANAGQGPSVAAANPPSTQNYDFKIGVDVNSSGGSDTDALNEKLNGAVQVSVKSVLDDYYSVLNDRLSKVEYKASNGGAQPPPSKDNRDEKYNLAPGGGFAGF
jgi:TP901 family phage tail tape measure protein